jgi:hypothetical protein
MRDNVCPVRDDGQEYAIRVAEGFVGVRWRHIPRKEPVMGWVVAMVAGMCDGK